MRYFTVFALALGLAYAVSWLWAISESTGYRILIDFNGIGEGRLEALMFSLSSVFIGFALAGEISR